MGRKESIDDMRQLWAIWKGNIEVISYNLQNKIQQHQRENAKYTYKSLISGIKLLLLKNDQKAIWSMWGKLPQAKDKPEKCHCSLHQTKIYPFENVSTLRESVKQDWLLQKTSRTVIPKVKAFTDLQFITRRGYNPSTALT